MGGGPADEISSLPGMSSSDVLEDEEVTMVAEEGVEEREEEESSNKSPAKAVVGAGFPPPAGRW